MINIGIGKCLKGIFLIFAGLEANGVYIEFMPDSFIQRLRRLPRSHGFGVQSPSDFHFVTEVLRGKIPRNVLEGLSKDKEEGKLLRLAYLVSKDRKPRYFLNLTQKKELEKVVCLASENCSICVGEGLERAELILADAQSLERVVEEAEKIADIACLIVGNIRYNNDSLKRWQRLIDSGKAAITFDLFSHGVALFDKKRYPQHYNVYF